MKSIPFASRWMVFWLVFFFAALGLKRAFYIVGMGLLLWGLWRFWTSYKQYLADPLLKWPLLAWVGVFAPLILALPDALFFKHSFAETLSIILLAPILFACYLMARDYAVVKHFLVGILALTVFWAFDVLLQYAVGYDIFGVPLSNRGSAYWQTPAKFGFYMGFLGLAAWIFWLVWKPRPLWQHALLWLILSVGVMLGANRGAWIIYFPGSLLAFWALVLVKRHDRWLWLFLGSLGLLTITYVSYQFVPNLQLRIDQSLVAFQGGFEAINKASSHRLLLWESAWYKSLEYWFNGMGQDAYSIMSLEISGDKVLSKGGVNSYPHQVILEIMTTTGIVGLIGIGLVVWAMTKAWKTSGVTDKHLAIPLWCFLLGLWFPLGTHRSFYSSELVMVNLIFLGLYFGHLARARA